MEKQKVKIPVTSKIDPDTVIKAKKKAQKEKPPKTISAKINELLYDYITT